MPYIGTARRDVLKFSAAHDIGAIDRRHRALQLQDAIVTIAEIVSQIPFVAFARPPWANVAKCVFTRLCDVAGLRDYNLRGATIWLIHRWLTAVPRDHLIINGAGCVSGERATWQLVNCKRAATNLFTAPADFNFESDKRGGFGERCK